MKTESFPRPSAGVSRKWKYLYLAIVGTVLVFVAIAAGGQILKNRHHPVSQQTSLPVIVPFTTADSTYPADAKPLYYKKEVVFKRMLAESEKSSIRTSAQYAGYKALSLIPAPVVAQQKSVRLPQFLTSSAMSNYQALSTLGTQQYYSNLKVQQFINNLNSQQYLFDLQDQFATNNLNNQQYLNNFNNNLNFEMYLNNFNNLNNQQYMNNFNNNMNNQQHLNNFNNLNNQQYMNNFNNNMNNQMYLNNFNNNMNTFSHPTITQPMPQIRPPTFNFP